MQLIRYSLYEAVVAVRNPKVNDEGVRFLLRFTARDSRMARRRLRDTIPGVTITKGPSRVPELKAEGKLFAEYSVQKNNRSIAPPSI